tara:strand:- start:114 stop:605 length:492 start_codon:yes stop_codon:yes gene_type:complete
MNSEQMPIPLNSGFLRLLEATIPLKGDTIIILSDENLLFHQFRRSIRLGQNGDFETLRDFDINCKKKVKKDFKQGTLLIDYTGPREYCGAFIQRFNPDHIFSISLTEPRKHANYSTSLHYEMKLIHCDRSECNVFINIYTKNCLAFQEDFGVPCFKKATVLLY